MKRIYLVTIIYISALMCPILFTALIQAFLNIDETIVYTCMNLVCSFIAILCMLYTLNINGLDTFNDFKGNFKPLLIWIISGTVIALLIQITVIRIENTFLNVGNGETNNFDTIQLIKLNWIALVSPVLLAPILEEIIFRKVIFSNIYFKTNFILASIISSVLFAIMHFNLTHFVTYTLIGILLCYLYHKTSRLIVPISVHIALNSIPVLLLFVS